MEEEKEIFINDADLSWENTGEGIKRKIMSYNPELMMVKVAFEKDAVGTLHKHPHTQITFIESGKFEVEVENEKRVLKAGDVFHIPSNFIHGVICLEQGTLIDVFNPVREDFLK